MGKYLIVFILFSFKKERNKKKGGGQCVEKIKKI